MGDPEPKRGTRARRKIRRQRERSSLQILEEAFHLLRTASVVNLWLFYLGAVPFVAAFLYFIADMSRSTFAARDAVPAAMLMVAAFFWMKYCQARFCAALWATINPGQTVKRKGWQRFRYTAALWCLQSFAGLALLLGLFFLIPAAWIIAGLQNITVLAFTQDYGRQPLRNLFSHSLRCAHYEWPQNHGILVILGFVGLFMWMNILATCLFVPMFAKSFLGIESMFTTNPEAAVQNSTFIIGTLLINWLVLSPVMKAVYVIRCFYAESRNTGADLLSRLESCREKREREQRRERSRRNSNAAAILIGIGLLFSHLGASTAIAAGEEEPTSARQLEEAISGTMEQKKYQWKISRHAFADENPEDQNWVSRKLTELADSVEALGKRIRKWWKSVNERFFKEDPIKRKSGGGSELKYQGLGSTMSIFLIIIVAGLLAWLVFVLVKNYKVRTTIEDGDSGFSGIIDLESEDIVASQLPEDEWMRLAQEQISKGETRLAIRALFLASLAHLGDRGMLKIERFKTNRTYRRELELRVRHRSKLREAFEENTNLFERVWYGLHEIGNDAVDHFMGNYNEISRGGRKL